jgi:Lon protease-like protein
MLADCLAGDRRFGIVFIPEEGREEGLERGDVGCIAFIQTAETLPDGRSNIIVVGEERFAVGRLFPEERPYLLGEVISYGDSDETGDALNSFADRLRGIFERVGRAARTLADDSDPLPTLPDDPGALSFTIASLIDLDPEGRQRLLASRSPLGRLRELDELLRPAVDALEMRAVVHRRAKTNGHGPSVAQ